MLKNEEHIVEYSNTILGPVYGLENAGPAVCEVEQIRALLSRLSKGYDVTIESIISFKHSYCEIVSKLILRKTRLGIGKDATPLALVKNISAPKQTGKCF